MMQKISRSLCLMAILVGVYACDGNASLDRLMSNPAKFESSYAACRQSNFSTPSCQQINKIYKQWSMAYVLAQVNPQGFGKEILLLQQRLVSSQQKLSKLRSERRADSQVVISQQKKVNQFERQNRLYLAVVRTLESPES